MRHTDFVLHASDTPLLAEMTAEHCTILAAFKAESNYDTLAADLGLPLGTVKSRLFRARERLSKLRARTAVKAEAA